ncbi:ABC-type transport auxiliary lipoprotein family protein [Parendozoicomonas sp. Alg238-R29]|uniref:PqiC family protein n=1 Tax=Parendozoicomonas sp. Alg238-R29 TaxID=2993446 RepID=UPI00248EE9E5|nr:ABC-type transport auxiliary lipoprotein family protein [Parendozoicomonas sp. Alg238-R29]
MFKKSWAIALCILTGCVSQTQAPIYLLLDQPTISVQQARGDLEKVDVKVSSYLQQPQLAISAGDHRIQFSDNYLWAEPLDTALTAALKQQLEQILPARKEKTANVSVFVRRLNFRPDGQVQMTGEFTVDLLGQKNRYPFNFVNSSGTSNYADMVGSVPSLVKLLAEDIAEKL